MRIMNAVEARGVCTVRDIPDGETFEWDGRYYIRPQSNVRDSANIGGVNLETGDFVSNSAMLMVRRVKMEARVL
jgi:hypothetical protein